MNIIFDTGKDEANQAKHHCSLALAEMFDWDTASIAADDRRNYGEARFYAIGYIGQRLFVVIFTDRGEDRRIISLRKANKREVLKYASA